VSKRHLIVPMIIMLIISGIAWQNGFAGAIEPAGSMAQGTSSVHLGQTQSGLAMMNVRAFPLYAIAAREGKQTIYILVQDRIYNPIPNAEITLIVQLPGSAEQRYIVQSHTNKDGFTLYTFPYSTNAVGNVLISVSAKLGNSTAQTTTSFMIWW
jgi:hypothetical protein